MTLLKIGNFGISLHNTEYGWWLLRIGFVWPYTAKGFYFWIDTNCE